MPAQDSSAARKSPLLWADIEDDDSDFEEPEWCKHPLPSPPRRTTSPPRRAATPPLPEHGRAVWPPPDAATPPQHSLASRWQQPGRLAASASTASSTPGPVSCDRVGRDCRGSEVLPPPELPVRPAAKRNPSPPRVHVSRAKVVAQKITRLRVCPKQNVFRGEVECGEEVELFRKEGDFTLVRSCRYTGFIRTKYLQAAEAPRPAPASIAAAFLACGAPLSK
eukprot:TRINITY_DN36501_c0_g1_i1.p1 TRINITY_DN36501_c0_g1~~TRINITY_DN36501_c0_g1_i1.p1  ORF type:complete len:241 (+),score=61.26 TRINITY_DN36501_c0_g1_i1:58-723(+)